jgi:hypothetical protein
MSYYNPMNGKKNSFIAQIGQTTSKFMPARENASNQIKIID